MNRKNRFSDRPTKQAYFNLVDLIIIMIVIAFGILSFTLVAQSFANQIDYIESVSDQHWQAMEATR